MIIADESISLQNQYVLKMNENELSLNMGEKKIGTLQVQVDSFYELPNYRLLGVNYDKIIVINYFDRLKIEE